MINVAVAIGVADVVASGVAVVVVIVIVVLLAARRVSIIVTHCYSC